MQPERQQRLHDGDKGLKVMDASHATPLPDKELLVFILKRLQKKDIHAFFSVPVGPNKLPNYHAIVKQPMDFGTICCKLDKGLYSNLEEFEKDVFLMCSNAKQYFPSHNLYHWQADSIFDLAKILFNNLREEGKMREEEEEEAEEKYELGLEELQKLEAEFKQLALGIETDDGDDDDDVDDDDDFEVEELTIPMVVDRIVDGNKVHEIVVPVIKDDDHLTPSMYCDDIIQTDSKRDFAQKLELSKELLPKEFECSICFLACDLISGGEHQASALLCGHIFGRSCIQKWLQMKSSNKLCPKCNTFCSLDDIRPLRKTSIRIPPVDRKISARRFPLSHLGFLQFHKLETARRNFALIKWSRARMRLDEVLMRVQVCSRLADKNLQQAEEWKAKAEAWNVKAKGLMRRAKGYNRRVDAHIPRLEYFLRTFNERDL